MSKSKRLKKAKQQILVLEEQVIELEYLADRLVDQLVEARLLAFTQQPTVYVTTPNTPQTPQYPMLWQNPVTCCSASGV